MNLETLLRDWFIAHGGVECDGQYADQIGFEDRETFSIAKLTEFIEQYFVEAEMKQYVVVNDYDLVSFQEEVDKLLTQGFILVGGVSAVFDQGENRMHWYQAMGK